jgi:hypothetical protein
MRRNRRMRIASKRLETPGNQNADETPFHLSLERFARQLAHVGIARQPMPIFTPRGITVLW